MPRRVCDDNHVEQDEKDNPSALISLHLNYEESEIRACKPKNELHALSITLHICRIIKRPKPEAAIKSDHGKLVITRFNARL